MAEALKTCGHLPKAGQAQRHTLGTQCFEPYHGHASDLCSLKGLLVPCPER